MNVSEENQRVASCVFPAAMAVISPPLSLHRRHTQSALSLITSCLASNGTHIYLLTQSLEPFLPDCTYNFTIILCAKLRGHTYTCHKNFETELHKSGQSPVPRQRPVEVWDGGRTAVSHVSSEGTDEGREGRRDGQALCLSAPVYICHCLWTL